MSSYMGFVGVTTSGSSIMKIFPEWARILHLPTDRLTGHDLPLGAGRDQYRELVTRIRDDASHRGALVTTHKMDLYQAAHDLFDEIDEFGTLCGEISSISKRDGRLIGHAKDPITAGLALEEFLPPGHFKETGAHVICLGAGGAGTALTWYLAGHADAPEKIICTDTSPVRLQHLADVHARGQLPASLFEYRLVERPEDTARVLAEAPAGSLVVNASGLGKDRPGSPVPDGVDFPREAIVWEFNYRGSLEFLAQARAQEERRQLTVVDGWRYFIHGWSQVIAEVFDVELTGEVLDRLADAAAGAR
ncbi:shikimate dehydrogenase family protein [Arthrobacter sp. Hor0625]|uniref:shikimate dehydrogenase family protein n=1 Tax=Arthrobacter sp. Hor0625 TaxID=3457358 RepID=UPI00403E729B